jgi:hypothetical protein
VRSLAWIVRALRAGVLPLGSVALVGACEASVAPTEGAGGASTTSTVTGTGGAGGAGGASTTTPTTTTPTTTTTTTGAGGQAPLTCAEKYTSLKGGPCDLLAQNCGPGETCRPWSTANGGFTTKCLTNSGLKSRGATCHGDAECEAHLFCTGNQNIAGQCSPVCCPADDQPCGGGRCNLNVSLGPKDFVFQCTYLTACTLLTKDACPDGEDCHLQDKEGYAACIAPSGTHAPEGGACQYINDCGDMQLCAQGVCRYNCMLGAAGQGVAPGLGGCPTGQTCAEAQTGLAGVGVCAP